MCNFWTSCIHVCEPNIGLSWKVLENEFCESWKTLKIRLCKSWKVLKNSILLSVRTLVSAFLNLLLLSLFSDICIGSSAKYSGNVGDAPKFVHGTLFGLNITKFDST